MLRGICVTINTVCPTVEAGPKWKLGFRYPLSQFLSDCHDIFKSFLSSYVATTLKILRNSIDYLKKYTIWHVTQMWE